MKNKLIHLFYLKLTYTIVNMFNFTINSQDQSHQNHKFQTQ